jgi:hypothetical protein
LSASARDPLPVHLESGAMPASNGVGMHKVSGCTMRRTRFHSDQNRRRMTQNTRSWAARRGCGCLAAKTASC